jgi:hypothetical protein
MFDFLHVLQFVILYSFHLLLPGLIAWIFFRKKWKTASLIMIGTMLIDLDHLLANPVFDPNRCSIGFHPLHSPLAIFFLFLLLFIPNVYIRIVSAGLLLHMITDFQDCLWINFLG